LDHVWGGGSGTWGLPIFFFMAAHLLCVSAHTFDVSAPLAARATTA
jgi:hypothetical protein